MLSIKEVPKLVSDMTAMVTIGMFLSQKLDTLHHQAFANGRTSVKGMRYEKVLSQLLWGPAAAVPSRSALHDLVAFGRRVEVKLGEFRPNVIALSRLILDEPEAEWPLWAFLVRSESDPTRIEAIYLFTTRALIDHVGLDKQKARCEVALAGAYNVSKASVFQIGHAEAKRIALMEVHDPSGSRAPQPNDRDTSRLGGKAGSRQQLLHGPSSRANARNPHGDAVTRAGKCPPGTPRARTGGLQRYVNSGNQNRVCPLRQVVLQPTAPRF